MGAKSKQDFEHFTIKVQTHFAFNHASKFCPNFGSSGVQVVSVLAFCSKGLSSNPAEVYNYSENCY